MIDSPVTPAARRCPHCGGEIGLDARTARCPACLLPVAFEPAPAGSDDAVTVLPPRVSGIPTPDAASRLMPGQEFGPYFIVRLLGRGGMGEVYEAEQRELGRRVALKVLHQRLTEPHDRARFLREGQLAASISHPHSVYIFGSDEIAGIPVIAMEFLAGGTLQDRVRTGGPLPPAAAVDAILQVIAGLDAAYLGGILHRDVKPANCFTDSDGTVKVGDFGLSIPTQTPDVTVLTRTGAFQGTPQFAPPERLKGIPQDVRADIYAVGATLYYLLTGQPPFDDRDLMALVTRIATEAPRSPRELEPAIPRGLADIVLRCLAKDRERRPATYAALDDALRPFGSAAPTPATMGLRFVAGALDQIIWSIPLFPLNMALTLRRAADAPWWPTTLGLALIIAYYGISEGVWGASIGKRMAGLRVINADGQPPGLARAIRRAIVFQTPSLIGSLPMLFLGQPRFMEFLATSPRLLYAPSLGHWILLGLLFCTVRRRNGFAGVHELASGTRVVRRLERSVRSALDATRALALVPVARTGTHPYGPYDVVGTLGQTEIGELLIGFDPSLRRHVWIHTLPPGTPMVPPRIRDLSRPGRLRWLSGGRSNSDAWDAYEAVDGVPLARLLGASQPWRVVRPWLLDLAREIDAGLTDGSVATLTIERVWITRHGYAKLLDFRAPGAPVAGHQEEPATPESAQTFLASVARSALNGSSGNASGATAARARAPLPLSASSMLETLARRGFATSLEVVASTTALLQGPDRVGRWRRAVTLGLCGIVPTGMALLILVLVPLMTRVLPPDVMMLNNALVHLSSLSQNAIGDRAQERAALEVYIAARFRPMIANPQTWKNPYTASILGPQRALALRVVGEHQNVSSEELATATAALGPFLQVQEAVQRSANSSNDSLRNAGEIFVLLLTLIALFGIAWAFILRGGLLLRACGIAVVTRDGKTASRLRALWRGLVAWSLVPTASWLALRVGVVPRLQDVAIGLFLLGVAWALVHPTRGVQDRLAGTWLVPQ